MSKRAATSVLAAVAVVLFAATFARGGDMVSVLIPNGLWDAKVNDWVIFKMRDGSRTRHSVLARTGAGKDADITLRSEVLDGERVVSSRRWVQKVGEQFVEPPVEGEFSDNGEVDRSLYTFTRREDSISFDGSEMPIQVVEVYKQNNLLRTWYLSTQLPVYGVIKRSSGANRESDFEVVDFGFADSQ
ncbi:MAG: hypothetical protein LUE17_09800 [Planctomycetaceae bacterium]|nr:hypothetical protein [Planctomycetaceae bacterium]